MRRRCLLLLTVWLVVLLTVELGSCKRSPHRRERKDRRRKFDRLHSTTTISAIVPIDAKESDNKNERIVNGYKDDDMMEVHFDTGKDATCVDIPSNMSMCQGIGYTKMRLPNLLQHESLPEVAQQASSWTSLIASQCHPDTELFLCSLFSPVCLDQPIYPCRSLCELVKEGCETLLLRFGFPWPKMLKCEKFPSNDDLCITAQHAPTRDNSTSANKGQVKDPHCSACTRTGSVEELKSSYCAADFVARIKMEETSLTGTELTITAAKKMKIYKKPESLRLAKRRQMFYLENPARCDCYDLASYTTTEDTSQYLVMGRVDPNNRPVLTYVYKYDTEPATVRRALRSFSRDGDVCAPTAITDQGQGRKRGDRQNVKKDERKEKKRSRKQKKMERREKKKQDREDRRGEEFGRKKKLSKKKKVPTATLR